MSINVEIHHALDKIHQKKKEKEIREPLFDIYPEEKYDLIAKEAKKLNPGEKLTFYRIFRDKKHRVDFYPFGLPKSGKAIDDFTEIYQSLSNEDSALRFCGGVNLENTIKHILPTYQDKDATISLIYSMDGKPEACMEAISYKGESNIAELGTAVKPECRKQNIAYGSIVDMIGLKSRLGCNTFDGNVDAQNFKIQRLFQKLFKEIDLGMLPGWEHSFDPSEDLYRIKTQPPIAS